MVELITVKHLKLLKVYLFILKTAVCHPVFLLFVIDHLDYEDDDSYQMLKWSPTIS